MEEREKGRGLKQTEGGKVGVFFFNTRMKGKDERKGERYDPGRGWSPRQRLAASCWRSRPMRCASSVTSVMKN